MKLEVRNRIVMSHGQVVAEIQPSQPARRKWMSIRWVDHGVALVEFEHAREADTDGWFAPEDILDRCETHYVSIDDALLALADRGIDSELFDAPWKVDYPL